MQCTALGFGICFEVQQALRHKRSAWQVINLYRPIMTATAELI
jgi:hypothetical protein